VSGGTPAPLDNEAIENLDDDWRRACREDELARRLPEPPADSRLPELLTTATLADPDGYADGVGAEAAALARSDVTFDGAIKQFFLLGETFAPAVPTGRTQALVRALSFGVEVIGRSYVGRAEAAARTDELTTLPNERVFLDDLGGATKRVESTGGQFALAAIDLDGLKVANDDFGGHAAGDHYIRRFGAELLQAVRQYDGRAYRLHGDEFCVIFREHDRTEAESILATMRERDDVAPFSYGVAACPGDGMNSEGLVQIADRDRLYEMKQSRPRRAEEARAWLRSAHWDFEGGTVPPQRTGDTGPLARLQRAAFAGLERLCAWVATVKRGRGM
jgi:diguanylate cyclase (GGDEF)-like protein